MDSIASATPAADAGATRGALLAEVDMFGEAVIQRVALEGHFRLGEHPLLPRLNRLDARAGGQGRARQDQ